MRLKLFALLIFFLWVVPGFAQFAGSGSTPLPPDSIPFAPRVNYGTGTNPRSVFCADLDGDSDLDLVVADYQSNKVSILKNNGDGSFQTKVDYGCGSAPISVFCADLEGDDDLDLAVVNYQSNTVSILKNNGDGTFQSAVNYRTGGHPRSVFCADLDGDDDLDLAVANYQSNKVSILKNNGDGTFQTKVDYVCGSAPISVFCADLDGDLDLDLAVANSGSANVSILKNNGDGTFQTKIDYSAGDVPYSIFCAELDGDSDLDLAVTCTGSDISALRSNKDGNLQSLDVKDEFNTVGADRCTGIVSILENNGDGTFQNAVNYGTGIDPRSVFCADLDGDSYFDLIVANYSSNNVSVLRNSGDGTFRAKVNYGGGSKPISVFSADLNGDGDFDLVVANSNGNNVSILENLTQLPANQPPWAFHLLSPPDEDTAQLAVNFDWQTPYDPNFEDQIRYDLYLSTTPDFQPLNTIIDSNLLVSKHTDTLEIGTYYWKVKAKDNWGASSWSSETWMFFHSNYLTDTLRIMAFSPVDLLVTDPKGDSIGLNFNTIPGASYDTTQDINGDEDKDDLVTVPSRLIGPYVIRIVTEPNDSGYYEIGIRIDGSATQSLMAGHHSPPPGEVDTFFYNAPWYIRGDANSDWTIDIADVVYLLNYLFLGGPAPDPLAAGDINCDGMIDAGDAAYLLDYLFVNGPPPGC
jgi:6-phosphogluconolactonase (cycloisomerase 2 family)